MRSTAVVQTVDLRRVLGSFRGVRSQNVPSVWTIAGGANRLTISGIVDGCVCYSEVDATTEGEFSAVIGNWPIAGILPRIASSSIVLEADRGSFALQSAGSRFSLRELGIPAPIGMPPSSEADAATVHFPVEAFRRAVRLASLAPDEADEDQGSTPVQIMLSEDSGLVIAARSDFALSEATVTPSPLTFEAAKARVGFTSAEFLLFALDFLHFETGAVVAVVLADRSIELSTARGSVRIPTLTSKRVPTTPFICVDPYLVELDRRALLVALDQISALETSQPAVHLTLDTGTLLVSGNESEFGHAVVEIPVESQLAVPPFKLRRVILRQWLRSADTDTVVLSWDAGSHTRIWSTSSIPLSARMAMATMN